MDVDGLHSSFQFGKWCCPSAGLNGTYNMELVMLRSRDLFLIWIFIKQTTTTQNIRKALNS